MISKKTLQTALTITSIAGAFASPIFAVACDRKARNSSNKIKPYIPAAVSVIVTAGCIAGSSYISKKRIATIAAASASGAAIFKEKYEKLHAYMQEHHPEELDDFETEELKAKMETAPEIIESNPNCHGEPILCFEGYSGRWFYSTEEDVIWAERVFNEHYKRDKYISLNDFYELLHIEQTHFGAQYGWTSSQGYCPDEIRFENTWIDIKGDGNKIYCIEIFDYPFESWFEI